LLGFTHAFRPCGVAIEKPQDPLRLKAVMNGRGDRVVDLAKTNLKVLR
jgi:hypothetical protein